MKSDWTGQLPEGLGHSTEKQEPAYPNQEFNMSFRSKHYSLREDSPEGSIVFFSASKKKAKVKASPSYPMDKEREPKIKSKFVQGSTSDIRQG
jgi:hypothetical protein